MSGRNATPTHRRATITLVGLLVAVTVAASCSGGSSGQTSKAPPLTAFTPLPPAGDCQSGAMAAAGSAGNPQGGNGSGNSPTPTLAPGTDIGSTGSGPGSGNPYTAAGARPVPGPHMPVTTLGTQPVSRVVARPPNPNMGSAAATPAGATTLPTPPTTSPAPLPPATSTTGSANRDAVQGHMGTANDPGCVLDPGDP